MSVAAGGREPILIVDDHPIFVDALRMALTPLIDGPEIATAGSLAEAEAFLRATGARLILLDLGLPDAFELDGAGRLKSLRPDTPLVIVSGRDDAATVALARAMGVAGFISKASPLSDIQVGLRLALAGRPVFPAAGPTVAAAAIASLTAGQARVLAAAASGRPYKQIAFDLGIAEPTLKVHMSAIFKKLGVLNRTQASMLFKSA
jgi:DNA-binding NarL/FixJ family response regulator